MSTRSKANQKANSKANSKKKQTKSSNTSVLVFAAVLFAALVVLVIVAWKLNTSEDPAPVTSNTPESTDPVYAQIEMADGGKIVLELYPEIAPATVDNFVSLVKSGFYDGLTFHRVIEGFMIQGGDPEGTGYGESAQKIKGEFTSNGFTNNLKHERGVISMARGNDKNSASSQFFIVHKTSPHLDGNYAAFGKVIYGMDVVDRIAVVKTDANNKPIIPVVMKKVTIIDKADIPKDDETSKEPDLSDLMKDECTYVRLDTADMGSIYLELYPEVAPITVENFVSLVKEGFYNGLTFHRIKMGSLIQGGDPNGDGTGGSAQTIKGEFSENGVENDLKHERGVISMARTSEFDSASSQFFIVQEALPMLDGKYAAFGKVIYGMDVVDAIAAGRTVDGKEETPVDPVVIATALVIKEASPREE